MIGGRRGISGGGGEKAFERVVGDMTPGHSGESRRGDPGCEGSDAPATTVTVTHTRTQLNRGGPVCHKALATARLQAC